MSIDYTEVARIIKISFGKLNKPNAKLSFPKPGTLANLINDLIEQPSNAIMPHKDISLLASAGVEMWHRAIHSLLWSLALTEQSPLWASVIGYYSSHFVMRAFAHSMGIFKSFFHRKIIQIKVSDGSLVCTPIIINAGGEHPFYWRAVKEHPKYASNPLFRKNSERDLRSESAHRTFANYTDHVGGFSPLSFPDVALIAKNIKKISGLYSVTNSEPEKEIYPDRDCFGST